jgi:MFS family permease
LEQAARPTRGARANVLALLAAAVESLRDRHFRTYWLSNSLFFIGQGLVLLGAQWLMLTLTDSRTLLGAIAAVQGGVVFLLSPVAGVMADRLARRNLLVWGRLGFTMVMVVMGLLVVTDAVRWWHLLLASGISSIFLALSQPATQTYVYDLVGRERLTNAIALNSMATGVFLIAGPSMGGALVATIGPQGTYFAGGFGYFIGALLLLTIPVLGKTAGIPQRSSFAHDIAEGARYVRRDPLLPWFFLAASVTFFCSAIITLRPVFAKEILMVGPVGLGWMGAAFGAGSLVGSLFVAALGERLKLKGLTMLLSCLGWCMSKVIYSQSHWFPLNLGLEFGMGLVPPFWVAAAMTILQVRVPEHLRSRVMAVHFMVLQFSQINGLTAGLMADHLGDRMALLLMGAIPGSIIVLMLVFSRKLILLGSQRHPLVPYNQAASGGTPTPSPGRAA